MSKKEKTLKTFVDLWIALNLIALMGVIGVSFFGFITGESLIPLLRDAFILMVACYAMFSATICTLMYLEVNS